MLVLGQHNHIYHVHIFVFTCIFILLPRGSGQSAIATGFIRSGKIRGKHIFFEMVRESQGKSGKVREFNEKVRENLEKVREIFLESSYLL